MNYFASNSLIRYIQSGGVIDALEKVRAGSRAGTNECAAWSNRFLRKNGYLISGNAWSLNDVDLEYSGYKGLNKPESYKESAVRQYNSSASDNIYRNFDSNSLDKDDVYVVNMYYRGSPSQRKAYTQGRGVTGSHTGILYFSPSNNKWVVKHNIHGTIYQEPFVQLQSGSRKYGVTAIYSPRKNNLWNRGLSFLGIHKTGGLITGPKIEI